MRPDDRIKSYVIIGEAGRGGMGIVYHARDESLDRDVAIKVLPEVVAFNPERMARFEREAKLLASLHHPNIALIYGLEQEERTAFLVLEYVEGETLAARTGSGPMPWREAVPIAIQVATAIEYAHRKGVIHRDLKPANIKFDHDGNAKVLDFGLAKVMNDQSSEVPSSGSSAEMETIAEPSGPSGGPGSTLPGVLIGTMGYASPEQARGKGVDNRTDVFSFGCVLFEMLAGGPPFPAETAADALGKTLHKEPDWEQLPGDLPPRLRLLLQRCLAKDLKHRLCDIGDARLELDELEEVGPEAHQAAVVSSGGGGLWKAASALLFLCTLVLGGLLLLRPAEAPLPVVEDAPRPLVNRAIVFSEDARIWHHFSSDDGARMYAVVSRDVPSELGDGSTNKIWDICVRDRHDPELRSIHSLMGLAAFDFSPDARSFYIRYAGGAFRGDIDSDIDPVELPRLSGLEDPSGGGQLFPAKQGAVWFDEETIVIEGFDDSGAPALVLIDARTGAEKRRVTIDMGGKVYRRDGLIDRFDDEHVTMYLSRYGDDGFSVNIATISLETGEAKLLVERSGDCQLVGNQLFFTRGDTLFMAEWDPVGHRLLDAGRPVQKDLNALYSVHGAFEISADGSLFYKPGGFQAGACRLMTNSGAGLEATELPEGPYDNSMAVSPDGSRICVTRLRGDGLWEVWAGTFDPPRLRRLYHANDIDHFMPMFSHDGELVKVSRIHNSKDGEVSFSVVVGPYDGSRPGKVVWDSTERDPTVFSGFSPDGTRLLGHRPNPELGNSTLKLVELDLETLELRDVLARAGGAFDGRWAPDGSLIAFKTRETGQPELHVFDPETGRTALVSTRPAVHYGWIVDETDGSLALHFWDTSKACWQTPVARSADGSFEIGEDVSVPWVYEETLLNFPAMDANGVAYTIAPGVDDEEPSHLVVIENWVDSVVEPKGTSSGS